VDATSVTQVYIADVLQCIRDHGLNVFVPGAPLAVPAAQPFSPAEANLAWTACRPVFLAVVQPAGTDIEQVARYLDCMVSFGYIDLAQDLSGTDAHRDATAQCRAGTIG
jgi:hypothetical protein